MTHRESHVTTIYPIAGGNGAAYVTIQMAYAFREVEKHKKIAVVDFDFNSPTLAAGLHEDNAHGIDRLVDKLNGNLLTTDGFLENMIKLKKDIHLLRGSQLAHRFPFVSQAHLDQIVGLLREEYDYIFIATSEKASDGGTPVALFHADTIAVVGRYTHKNEWRLKEAISTVKGYAQTKTVAVVYNLFEDQNKMDFSKQLPESWKVAGTLPYLPSGIDNKNVTGQGALSFTKGKRSDETKNTYESLFHTFFKIGGDK